MRKLTRFTIAALGLALSLSSVASAGRSTGSVFVRGGFEYTGQSLDDLKDYQDSNNELLALLDLSPSWKNVGAAPGFDLELGYQVSPAISVGIGFARARHSRENSSTGTLEFVDENGNPVGTGELAFAQDLGAAISEITGNVTFWAPGAAGLFLGVQAGWGMGDFTETQTATLTSNNSELLSATSTGEYEGNSFVGGVFAGYDLSFSNGVSLFAKAGYRLRNLGKLKGHAVPLQEGEPARHEMTYEDLDGNQASVGFDFSGMFASAGLGFSFGGAAR